ncbi:IS4 family transposase [Moorena sp. SIO3B2]|uniref:IS4 family transposase n=1 Tax=Moorena sp. SIO3B2 TaxID=2607827 RepID=UPI0013CCAA8E|nr:IS4 family transposase [Moorena sp. SIO3B2]NEP35244.1 IS4 family transposase [Moorena sp. SIO3B2]
MLPELYQIHFEQYLKESDYLLFEIIINLVQSIKQVSLEKLAASLPLPIKYESRRKKLQRFLSLTEWDVNTIWLSLITQWISQSIDKQEVQHIAIDRTRWQSVNILVISLIYQRRAIPLYFELLDKKGNSNYDEQTQALEKVLGKFTKYKVVVLGDREFCSVDLATWLKQKDVYFCLRLKKNHFIEQETEIWTQLQHLGLKPGISFYLQGIKITKTKQVLGFDLAAKWQQKRWGMNADEGWFILTNLGSLTLAIEGYKKRFGIEEMFRYLKKGGYNLEGTKLTGQRLVSILIRISVAYTISTFSGQIIKRKCIQDYVGRVKEVKRIFSRHSNFYIGLYGYNWVNFYSQVDQLVDKLMKLSPNKRPFYQRGLKAMTLIISAF